MGIHRATLLHCDWPMCPGQHFISYARSGRAGLAEARGQGWVEAMGMVFCGPIPENEQHLAQIYTPFQLELKFPNHAARLAAHRPTLVPLDGERGFRPGCSCGWRGEQEYRFAAKDAEDLAAWRWKKHIERLEDEERNRRKEQMRAALDQPGQ